MGQFTQALVAGLGSSFNGGMSIGARGYEKGSDEEDNKIQRAILGELHMAQMRNMQEDNARATAQFNFNKQKTLRQQDAQDRYFQNPENADQQTQFDAFGTLSPARDPRQEKVNALQAAIKNSDDDVKVLSDQVKLHSKALDELIPGQDLDRNGKDGLTRTREEISRLNNALITRNAQLMSYRRKMDELLQAKLPDSAFSPPPPATFHSAGVGGVGQGSPAGPAPTYDNLGAAAQQQLQQQNSQRYATPDRTPQPGVGAYGPAMVPPGRGAQAAGPTPSTMVPNSMVISQPERYITPGTLPNGQRVVKDTVTGKWVYIDPAR